MNYERAKLRVMAENDPAKQYAAINSDTYSEMRFMTEEKAPWYPPSSAVRRVEVVQNGADAGKPMPPILLSLQAVFEDGSVVPGCPAPRYVAPKAKTPAIPELPSVPPVVQFKSDNTWRVVPVHKFKTAYSTNGTYSQCPYAFEFNGSPFAGYFKGQTVEELFQSIMDTTNDAIASGTGQWLDPRDGRSPGTPTREQIFRSTWPIATPAQVQDWLAKMAARDQAIAAAEAEKYREPTEAEIQAADVRPETLAKMPADVLRARYLSDKAFRVAYDRKELFEKKVREKEERERAQAVDREAVDYGLKVLANREQGITSER